MILSDNCKRWISLACSKIWRKSIFIKINLHSSKLLWSLQATVSWVWKTSLCRHNKYWNKKDFLHEILTWVKHRLTPEWVVSLKCKIGYSNNFSNRKSQKLYLISVSDHYFKIHPSALEILRKESVRTMMK